MAMNLAGLGTTLSLIEESRLAVLNGGLPQDWNKMQDLKVGSLC